MKWLMKSFMKIRETSFEKFNLTCMHIYHSLGMVKASEICMFLFVSSTRRKRGIQGDGIFGERDQGKVPIFGKELFEDASSMESEYLTLKQRPICNYDWYNP